MLNSRLGHSQIRWRQKQISIPDVHEHLEHLRTRKRPHIYHLSSTLVDNLRASKSLWLECPSTHPSSTLIDQFLESMDQHYHGFAQKIQGIPEKRSFILTTGKEVTSEDEFSQLITTIASRLATSFSFHGGSEITTCVRSGSRIVLPRRNNHPWLNEPPIDRRLGLKSDFFTSTTNLNQATEEPHPIRLSTIISKTLPFGRLCQIRTQDGANVLLSAQPGNPLRKTRWPQVLGSCSRTVGFLHGTMYKLSRKLNLVMKLAIVKLCRIWSSRQQKYFGPVIYAKFSCLRYSVESLPVRQVRRFSWPRSWFRWRRFAPYRVYPRKADASAYQAWISWVSQPTDYVVQRKSSPSCLCSRTRLFAGGTNRGAPERSPCLVVLRLFTLHERLETTHGSTVSNSLATCCPSAQGSRLAGVQKRLGCCWTIGVGCA